jgi:branched-subunit amino acid transport protein
MTTWMTIVGMSLVSYGLRVTMLLTARPFPAWLAKMLAYVPIALFAALAVPGLLRPHGEITVGPEVATGGVAALVAWRTAGRMPLVLGAGMATFLLVRLLT